MNIYVARSSACPEDTHASAQTLALGCERCLAPPKQVASRSGSGRDAKTTSDIPMPNPRLHARRTNEDADCCLCLQRPFMAGACTAGACKQSEAVRMGISRCVLALMATPLECIANRTSFSSVKHLVPNSAATCHPSHVVLSG